MFNRIFAFLILSSLSLHLCEGITCNRGGIVWQNSCLYYNTTELGFVVAENWCQQIGGHLVSVHDAFTNAFIGEKAGQLFQNWYNFWIGGNTLMAGGSAWTWTDNTPFNFADWTNDEPDSGKQCIVASTSDGYWSTEACSKGRPFICSISATGNQPSTRPLPTTTTTRIVNQPSTRPLPTRTTPKPAQQYRNCTFGWVYFEPTNSCYGYNNKGIMMNWTSAETFCNSQGAHLASIHSYEEQMFINEFGLVSWKSIWLGLYSIDLGQTWRWTDGSPYDYSYWYQGQPPHIYSGQNCVLLESSISTSGYQSSPCTYNWYPICKKPYYG